MTPKNCFDRKAPNTEKGSVLFQNKGVHAVFFILCAKVTIFQVLIFVHGVPRAVDYSDLGWVSLGKCWRQLSPALWNVAGSVLVILHT